MDVDQLFQEGKYEEALKSYLLLLKNSTPRAAVSTKLRIVECLCRTRQYARARRELMSLKNSPFLRKNTALYGEYLAFLADVNTNLGDYGEARRSGEEAFEILRKTDENELIAKVQRILGVILLSEGNFEEAQVWFEDLLSTYRRTGNEKDTMFPLNGLAQLHFCAGRWAQAIECLERGLEASTRLGKEDWTCAFLLNLGTVHRRVGNWSMAGRQLLASIKSGRRLGDTLQVVRGELSLASLYLLQRDWRRASSLLERCRRISAEEGYRRELCLSYEGLGRLAYAQMKYVEAEGSFVKAHGIATEIAPRGDLLVELTRWLADLYASLGKPDESLGYIDSALRAAGSLKDQYEEACTYRARALACDQLGQLQETQRSFRQAIRLFDKLGDKFERGRTLVEYGKFMRSQSDSDEALHQFFQAEELFRAVRSVYWAAMTQFEIATTKFGQDEFDSAVSYMNRAAKAFEELAEREAVVAVSKLKENVEERMIESALRTTSRPQTSIGDLRDFIQRLVKEVRADRAFLALGNGCDLEVAALHNITEEEARHLISSCGSLRSEKPLISTNLYLDSRFRHLEKDGIFSFIFLPFGPSGKAGTLYVDSRDAFSQKDLTSSVRITQDLAVRISEIRQRELEEENLRLRKEIQKKGYPEIVTRNDGMLEILEIVDKIKDDSAPVLIQGETGTGKELIARALHYKSQRKSRPFVPLDCGTPTETLAESEFFGHKRGSFTDAKEDKPGLFEQANGGSLFLDEVANLSEDVQAKLLRVLQEGKVRRVGETRERKVNVRVIAASNRDLEKEVTEGRFRKDLYYRLKGIRIQLPPLRERKDDIPLLVQHFVDKFSKQKKKPVEQVTDGTVRALTRCDWQGNVRELESEIERAVVLMENGRITPDLLSSSTRKTTSTKTKKYSLQALIRALDENQWVKRKTARALGIPESTLRKRLKTQGIRQPSDVRTSGAR